MNLFAAVQYPSTGNPEGVDMPNPSNLRKWAAEATRQAKLERNADEARRLLSFARYWTRLADTEEWQRDQDAA
jgi:hypothetical protein